MAHNTFLLESFEEVRERGLEILLLGGVQNSWLEVELSLQ